MPKIFFTTTDRLKTLQTEYAENGDDNDNFFRFKLRNLTIHDDLYELHIAIGTEIQFNCVSYLKTHKLKKQIKQ